MRKGTSLGMFTGIIEATSPIVSNSNGRLAVQLPDAWAEDPLKIGESVSVNGCCLTVTQADLAVHFDLSEETLRRTTLIDLDPGHVVNLERALRIGDRLGGHFVQGHIDLIGQIVLEQNRSDAKVLRVKAGRPDLLIDKGSVAIDGVSLTVVQPRGSEFEVWLVPETLRRSTLGNLVVGSQVNIEFDVLAKHIAHLASLSKNV